MPLQWSVHVRREQVDTLGASASEEYCERVAEHLREHFTDAREVPHVELLEGVRLQVARAGSYGFVIEEQVATYVTTAWLLGDDFDVVFPVAREILTSARSADERSQRLRELAVALLDTLESGG